jgi:hypothetical protein
MRRDDLQVQVTMHNEELVIIPLAQIRVGKQWVERPLTTREQFRVALLGHEVLLAAIREFDSCQLKYELELHPDKIPEGTYILDAAKVFHLDEAIAAAWDADVLGLLHREPTLTGFPRVWELLGFLFCKKTREEKFDPSYHVLLADYLENRKAKFQSPWAQRWLSFCFSVRTFALVAQCCGTAWRVAIVGTLMTFGPRWLKDLLRDIFQDQ